MTIVTVLAHLLGLALLIRLLKAGHLLARARTAPLTLLVEATLGLFAIHTFEIWLYAAVYVELGALSDFETALYLSTISYASVGYGDVLLPNSWRILGGIEGVTGVLMLGWSTAFLVSLIAQLRLLSHDWLTPAAPRETGRES